MSLNFDYAAVPTLPNGDDPKEHPYNRKHWHAVGDALVWASISVGIDVISDKTIDLWEKRLNILQRIDGPLTRFNIDGEVVDAYVTRADLEAFKGLKTNARFAPYETDAQWLKRIMANEWRTRPYARDARPAYEIAHEAAEKAFMQRVREQVEEATAAAVVDERAFEVLLHANDEVYGTEAVEA